jgi:hypothetical protein
MPRALQRREMTLLARSTSLCIILVLLLSCREQNPPPGQTSSQPRAPASAAPARARRPAPTGAFDCRELRPVPKTESPLVPETIELAALGTGKKVFLKKTGEFLIFDREEFLKAARCMKAEKAVRFLEEETGREQESPILDAFQLTAVTAAMLDAGRAGIRLVEEREWRKSIVRDGWSADGCVGRCREFGRMYRLSEDDSFPFLRITDQTRDK